MVKIVVSMLVFLFNLSIHAQNDSLYWELMAIDTPPFYNNNEHGLKNFIQKQIKYPEKALTDSVEGIVIISLWIDTTGYTYTHKIIRGVREDLNDEALRVAKLIKFERPAMQRGKPISVMFTVPIEFKLPRQGKSHRMCK